MSPNGVGTHGVSLALGDGHNPVRTVSIIAGFSMESNTPPRGKGDGRREAFPMVYDRRLPALLRSGDPIPASSVSFYLLVCD